MARINVEFELLSNPLFHELSQAVGGIEKAMGMLVLFWFSAQRHWGRGELLPKHKFPKSWQPLLDCGLAMETEDGIYARGGEAQFGWYRERIAAGRKGGAASASKRQANDKQKPTKHQPTGNPLTLTLTQKKKEEEEGTASAIGPPDPWEIKPNVKAAWERAYGAETVEAEIDLAIAGWMSEPENSRSPPMVYLRRWFQNVAKQKKEVVTSGREELDF